MMDLSSYEREHSKQIKNILKYSNEDKPFFEYKLNFYGELTLRFKVIEFAFHFLLNP